MDEPGILVYGAFLGADYRTVGKDDNRRLVGGVSLALSGLDGAIEVRIPETLVKTVQSQYKIGELVQVRIEPPRAFSGRVYYTARTIGDMPC